MKRNSRYQEPSRELLAGVKRQGIGIELASEFPSEIEVGSDGSPPLTGQDIGMAYPYPGQKSGH